uniref:Uncharacterized protein n=1 Tax=Avena sativa TaxID=4498 RepID=A0ACD5V158_AVESA
MGEQAGAGDDHAPHVVVCKGKRSKRQRVHAAAPPSPATVIVASATDVESSSSDGYRSCADQEAVSRCVTEEEEDMAHCLMLLAQGDGHAEPGSSSSSLVVAVAKEGKFRSRRPADGAGAGAGEFVYECRTCGRCFPSFQALGGHRTSHKKPRLILPPTPPLPSTTTTPTTEEKKQRPAAEKKSPPTHATSEDPTVLLTIPATPPKQETAVSTSTGVTSGASRQQGSSRVHECSICGAEFASGQALGGHMRRHRPLVPATDVGAAAAVVSSSGKEKSLLELDLNMPAPCDDASTAGSDTTSFPFVAKERPSPAFPVPASALVDCHY